MAGIYCACVPTTCQFTVRWLSFWISDGIYGRYFLLGDDRDDVISAIHFQVEGWEEEEEDLFHNFFVSGVAGGRNRMVGLIYRPLSRSAEINYEITTMWRLPGLPKSSIGPRHPVAGIGAGIYHVGALFLVRFVCVCVCLCVCLSHPVPPRATRCHLVFPKCDGCSPRRPFGPPLRWEIDGRQDINHEEAPQPETLLNSVLIASNGGWIRTTHLFQS